MFYFMVTSLYIINFSSCKLLLIVPVDSGYFLLYMATCTQNSTP